MTAAFSRWWFFLNHRVVIWFPKTTRECFMYGFRWGDSFIGVVIRGEEIDPRQEAYYERVRNIAEVLGKEGQLAADLTSPPD
jgi:hypothetical protein